MTATEIEQTSTRLTSEDRVELGQICRGSQGYLAMKHGRDIVCPILAFKDPGEAIINPTAIREVCPYAGDRYLKANESYMPRCSNQAAASRMRPIMSLAGKVLRAAYESAHDLLRFEQEVTMPRQTETDLIRYRQLR